MHHLRDDYMVCIIRSIRIFSIYRVNLNSTVINRYENLKAIFHFYLFDPIHLPYYLQYTWKMFLSFSMIIFLDFIKLNLGPI